MRIAIVGSAGRMGQAVAAAAAGHAEVVAEFDRGGDLAEALDGCDAYIDFSSPEATRGAAIAATVRRLPAVIGTTGLEHADHEAIAALAQVAPVVYAANFSLGVNLVLGLAKQAARALADWDAEVVEIHHNEKRDAPSGTALAIARAMAAGRGVDYDRVKRHARDGNIGPRPRGEIGVSAVRGGDVVGEHVAYLFGAGERVEIGHRATSRAIFARGALRAAAWVVGKPPGRYDMLDVLGFTS
ncbi:MAG TPA: 4-hydroxy-tetrahydrodipicolinate reductase [Kofleriaceae bacterium]|nr:4-hydroxy-tetrahydrodipicolinate reductase [Kofleriaceae bacterium]